MHYEIKVYRHNICINVQSSHLFHVLAPCNRVFEEALGVQWVGTPNFDIDTLCRLLHYACELSRANIFEF